MRFMVIVPGCRSDRPGVLPSGESLAPMQKYKEELVNAGIMLASADLLPTSNGAKIRFEDGRRTVISGPFAETEELIAGFWLLETESKDEAIDWVKRAPFASGAEIVLRQVFTVPHLRRPGRRSERPRGPA